MLNKTLTPPNGYHRIYMEQTVTIIFHPIYFVTSEVLDYLSGPFAGGLMNLPEVVQPKTVLLDVHDSLSVHYDPLNWPVASAVAEVLMLQLRHNQTSY